MTPTDPDDDPQNADAAARAVPVSPPPTTHDSRVDIGPRAVTGRTPDSDANRDGDARSDASPNSAGRDGGVRGNGGTGHGGEAGGRNHGGGNESGVGGGIGGAGRRRGGYFWLARLARRETLLAAAIAAVAAVLVALIPYVLSMPDPAGSVSPTDDPAPGGGPGGGSARGVGTALPDVGRGSVTRTTSLTVTPTVVPRLDPGADPPAGPGPRTDAAPPDGPPQKAPPPAGSSPAAGPGPVWAQVQAPTGSITIEDGWSLDLDSDDPTWGAGLGAHRGDDLRYLGASGTLDNAAGTARLGPATDGQPAACRGATQSETEVPAREDTPVCVRSSGGRVGYLKIVDADPTHLEWIDTTLWQRVS